MPGWTTPGRCVACRARGPIGRPRVHAGGGCGAVVLCSDDQVTLSVEMRCGLGVALKLIIAPAGRKTCTSRGTVLSLAAQPGCDLSRFGPGVEE